MYLKFTDTNPLPGWAVLPAVWTLAGCTHRCAVTNLLLPCARSTRTLSILPIRWRKHGADVSYSSVVGGEIGNYARTSFRQR
jgi:hypothetical protein